MEAVFLHYRVPPAVLQPLVPFPLDLRDGAAWVSLVAFRMERMRPARGGRVGELIFSPLSPCRFLNVRTYVRQGGEPGIYFMKEWISSRLSVPLGPVSFGLPYEAGELKYEQAGGALHGDICARSRRRPAYLRGGSSAAGGACPCAAGSRDEFLLERYTAFTRWAGLKRCFRICHQPWEQVALQPQVRDFGLLRHTGAWSDRAELCGGNYSRGVFDVRIGWPRRIPAERRA